jgi:hypothetical protein
MLCISSNISFLGNNFFLCRPYGFGVLGQQTIGVKNDSKMVVILGI